MESKSLTLYQEKYAEHILPAGNIWLLLFTFGGEENPEI